MAIGENVANTIEGLEGIINPFGFGVTTDLLNETERQARASDQAARDAAGAAINAVGTAREAGGTVVNTVTGFFESFRQRVGGIFSDTLVQARWMVWIWTAVAILAVLGIIAALFVFAKHGPPALPANLSVPAPV